MAKSIVSCVATFLIILAAPLASALINLPVAERYKTRLTRFPDASHLSGFSPNFGRKSSDTKTSFTRIAFLSLNELNPILLR
ncbi:hypothetical protein [Dapis sp. BLCC M229]|uniref:hypothetical protein n=1 Tax=Dapis sp. BLCC M229 TaxID=3400188 RepID=UPI003CEB629B